MRLTHGSPPLRVGQRGIRNTDNDEEDILGASPRYRVDRRQYAERKPALPLAYGIGTGDREPVGAIAR